MRVKLITLDRLIKLSPTLTARNRARSIVRIILRQPSVLVPSIHTRYQLNRNVGSCYKIPKRAGTWNQAYAQCRADGGHLVVLNSQAEHDAVFALMNIEPKVENSQAWWYFYAGFRAENSEEGSPRVFKTIFNETLDEAGYGTWAENEPNNFMKHEDCGTLFKNDGKLNDALCNHLYGYICEKEVAPK
ncbi:hypothetical protein ACJJTC_005478 [Scirpophaga incertulas]